MGKNKVLFPLFFYTALFCLGFAPFSAGGATVIMGDLPRAAELGFRYSDEGESLEVGRVDPSGAAAKAGLLEKDIILRINGKDFPKAYIGADLLRRLDGHQNVTLEIQRTEKSLTIRYVPPAKPLEDIEGLDIEYNHSETTDGSRLRTILTRPSGATGPLPALFVTQWVSCSSIELTRGGATREILKGLALRSGMVLIRVERSASGDSEGPGCHELDYDTEVEHYRQAFDRLIQHPWVDSGKVVILGLSLGSTTAPLVAQGKKIAGVIVNGAGALTYVERMIDFDRLGFEFGGADSSSINDFMREHIEFHALYLIQGRNPDEIRAERPDLADVWDRMRGTGEGVHYGRPYAYHQQAAMKNFLAAWAGISSPVLVLYGEFDQFETARGHRSIVENINRIRPRSATYLTLPQTGHDYGVYASREDAIAWRNGQDAPELAIGPILQWLQNVVGIPKFQVD